MKAKTLLLGVAIFAAGLTLSTAQTVYSINAVGYVNVSLCNGYNLIANPVNGTNNNVNTIMPFAPDGSIILRWNCAGQTFFQAETYFGGTWFDGQFNVSTTVVNPGEGFFFQNNSGAGTTLTFVGEVPQGNLTNRICANYSFISSQVPQSGPMPGLNFPATDGMTLNKWNCAAQSYDQAYTFFGGQWYDNNFNPSDPVLMVGEACLITNPGGPLTWSRTFSVNN